MSTVKMKRVRLIALAEDRDALLAGLLAAGEEYELLRSDLEAFRNPLTGFDSLSVTAPPLSTPERGFPDRAVLHPAEL